MLLIILFSNNIITIYYQNDNILTTSKIFSINIINRKMARLITFFAFHTLPVYENRDNG
jgi:hypothetical protein